jgi:RHS repeat-associated protein
LKVKTTNAYDGFGRLTGITQTNGANVTIGTSSYIIDDLDRLKTETVDGQIRTIGYDSIDQVKTVTGSNSEAYIYDLNGNRINTGYTIDPDNRLRSDGSYNYLYDPEGNRPKRTEIATGIVDNYTWDYRNRLVSIVTVASGDAVLQTVEYEYDVDDQRVRKRITSALPTSGVVENYFIDRDQIAFVTDGSGQETFHYLYGLNIDAVMAQDSSTGMLWALADRLGSIDTITDASGNVVDKRTFDSFGRVLSETNPLVSFRYGYTGRERDLESGLSYYRARYYDPNVGRFISVDPLGFGAGDTNLYRYVGNSSTMATDPTGMFSLQELWNNGVNTAQNIWNGGVNNVQKAVNKVQQSVNNAGQAVVNGSISFRNTVTSNAQAGLEYWTGVAVAGQNEGGIIGGAKQVVGTLGGLLSSLATEDNIDRTNETLASVFGGSLLSGGAKAIAGLQQTKNIATAIAATRVAKAVTPFVTTVAPAVTNTFKAVSAFTGGYQGGTQLRQAWTGEDENGRQLSTPERVVAAINGVATIRPIRKFISYTPHEFRLLYTSLCIYCISSTVLGS